MKKRIAMIIGILILIYIIIQGAYSYYYIRKGNLQSHVEFTRDGEFGDKSKPKLSLYVDGDSVAVGSGASSFETSVAGRVVYYLAKDNNVSFKNAAVSGTKMVDMPNKSIPEYKQNLVLLIISSNDLFRFTKLSNFDRATAKTIEKYSKISDKLIIVGPGRVFESTAVPLPVRFIYKLRANSYAEIIDKYAKNYENVVHINPLVNPADISDTYGKTLAGDNFHPNDSGHKFWFDLVKKAL